MYKLIIYVIILQLSWLGLTSSSDKKNIMNVQSPTNLVTMLGKNIYLFKIAGLLGASAVILGAYGAHGK